jgi:hypothetical protein
VRWLIPRACSKKISAVEKRDIFVEMGYGGPRYALVEKLVAKLIKEPMMEHTITAEQCCDTFDLLRAPAQTIGSGLISFGERSSRRRDG